MYPVILEQKKRTVPPTSLELPEIRVADSYYPEVSRRTGKGIMHISQILLELFKENKELREILEARQAPAPRRLAPADNYIPRNGDLLRFQNAAREPVD